MRGKGKEGLDPPRERRVSRKTKLAAGGLIFAAGVGIVGKGNWHIPVGLVQDAISDDGKAIPGVPECMSDTIETTTTAPVITLPPKRPSVSVPETTAGPASTTVPAVSETTVPFLPPSVTALVSSKDAMDHESGVYDNEWLHVQDFVRMPLQIAEYFDNKVDSYQSSASGRIYDFYIFGEGEYGINLNIESIEALERAAFREPRLYDEDIRDTIVCMDEALFEERKFAGTRTAVVIPAAPAYMQNGLIKFGSAEKGKSGFTMPKLKGTLSKILPDAYSDFMILTTGPHFDPESPIISNSIVAHEVAHQQTALMWGDAYSLEPRAEERQAHIVEQGALLSPGFYGIEPLVSYYPRQ